MINFSEIGKGARILVDGKPYEVLEANHLKKAQRRPVLQARMLNLITGKIVAHTIHQGESFDQPEMAKKMAKFVYGHREKFIFCDIDNPANRFELLPEQMGAKSNFLKPGQEVETLSFEDQIISIDLPIKMIFKVIDAPPGLKGDTAQGGVKQVKIETGYQLNVPLFIAEGEQIEINTETGEYVRRAPSA